MNDPSETPSSLVFTNDAAAAFANGLESGRTASSTLPDRIMGGLLGFNGGEVVAASEVSSCKVLGFIYLRASRLLR